MISVYGTANAPVLSDHGDIDGSGPRENAHIL